MWAGPSASTLKRWLLKSHKVWDCPHCLSSGCGCFWPFTQLMLQSGHLLTTFLCGMGFLTTWRPLGWVETLYWAKGTECPFLTQPCRPLSLRSAVFHWLHTSKALGVGRKALLRLEWDPKVYVLETQSTVLQWKLSEWVMRGLKDGSAFAVWLSKWGPEFGSSETHINVG